LKREKKIIRYMYADSYIVRGKNLRRSAFLKGSLLFFLRGNKKRGK